MKHFYTISPYQNNLSSKFVENNEIDKEMLILLHGSCDTDLKRSIAEVADTLHTI